MALLSGCRSGGKGSGSFTERKRQGIISLHFVRLATFICGTPVAAVTLVDEHRQWFKSKTGLDMQEALREAAFCAHTIFQSDRIVVCAERGHGASCFCLPSVLR